APGRSGHSRTRVLRFVAKLQQFTGPVMAKALEDTAFYRYPRLVALNEVGGDPAAGGLSVAEFHARMMERAKDLPHGMNATATHDTKRGEDARARILALSELAEDWARELTAWRSLNARFVDRSRAANAPTEVDECLLHQALLGAWPPGGPSE